MLVARTANVRKKATRNAGAKPSEGDLTEVVVTLTSMAPSLAR